LSIKNLDYDTFLQQEDVLSIIKEFLALEVNNLDDIPEKIRSETSILELALECLNQINSS
jgi:hypothetical protein